MSSECECGGVVLTILVMTLVPVSSSGSISPLDKYENRCCWMLLIQQLFLSVYCMLLLLFTFASESTFMEIYKWQYKQSHMQHDYACTQSNKDICICVCTYTYLHQHIHNKSIYSPSKGQGSKLTIPYRYRHTLTFSYIHTYIH